MGALDDRQRVGRHGTDLPSIHAVQDAVGRLVRKQWSGWSLADQQDLTQQVMVKYFRSFGRHRLPDNVDGNPAVPAAWLMKVIRNAGVDFHRQQEARPAEPVAFDDVGLDRLARLVQPQPSLASDVAHRIDVEGLLRPALQALAKVYPMDAKLIVWRYVQDREMDEIAKIRGTTVEATKKAIQRAVKRLRNSMTDLPDDDRATA